MDLSTVDVVIVARSDGPILRRAIAAVLGSAGVQAQVTIVDTGATPPIADVDDERVSVVRPSRPVGFAHARNLGIAHGHAPSVLLLDPEVLVNATTIRRLLDQLDGEVAAVAPTFAGLEPEDTAGRAWTLSAAVRRHQATSTAKPLASNREAVWAIDYATGSCLLIERAAWESVGGFDETFSHGPDDLDFCLRLRAGRRRIVQVRAAIAAFVAEPRTHGALSLDGARQRIDAIRTIRKHRRTVA